MVLVVGSLTDLDFVGDRPPSSEHDRRLLFNHLPIQHIICEKSIHTKSMALTKP